MKAMFTVTVFEIFFFEGSSALWPAQQGTGSKRFNADKIFISKLVKIKTNSKYLIGHLDKVIWPLVLIIPQTSRYVKTCKVAEGNNQLMCFRIDDEKLLEKYKSCMKWLSWCCVLI